jgi:hypothetical protein
VADQLCTPEQLASALQQDLDAATANLWVNAATAVVQAACGRPPQRILQVVEDTFELIGTTDAWLRLPQRPTTAVDTVTLDGVTLTDVAAGGASGGYRRHGSRLWRAEGWQTYAGEPSTVAGVYTHGYPDGHQGLELARSAVLGLAKQAYANVAGAQQERIDDYAVVFAAVTAALEASPTLRAALRSQYGAGAGLVRIG